MKGLNMALKILLVVSLAVTGLRALTYYPRAFDTNWQAALMEAAGVVAFVLLIVIGVWLTDKKLKIRWSDW